jgi:hypothetical protein
MNELLNFCLDQLPVDMAQALSPEMVVALSLPSTSQREAAGAMRIDPSRVEFRKSIFGVANAARLLPYSVLRRNLRST